MNFKFRIIFVFLFVLAANESLFGQVSVKKSEVDYSFTYEEDSVLRILSFWKEKDSEVYSSVKYSISDFNKISSPKKLSNEINTINQLWNIAKDSIAFNLESFNIGYPLIYSDVLKNHIQAFFESKEWKNHILQYGKTIDVNLIRNIMLEQNEYGPLNIFLTEKGYQIAGFETEKHGFVTKEKLQEVSFTGSEITPMPYIVWVKINKTEIPN
jgi:hypothetical protein